MDERLHQALDAELASHEVTPAMAETLDDARALFAGVVRAVPTRPIPDLGAAVLRRIEAIEHAAVETPRAAPPARRHQRGGLAAWLWSPRPVSLSIRPAYALAAAIVLAIGIGMATTGVERLSGDQPIASAGSAQVLVHFRLDAPQAKTVTLAGDFSEWTPAYAMQRSEGGVWTIVVPLAPGVHEYAFIVDGTRWVPDPAAPAKPDGFGGMNSRLAVLGPDRRS